MKATRTELKNKTGKLLKASYFSPVIITDRGSDSHVLMTIEEYTVLLDKLQQLKKCCKDKTPLNECSNTHSKD